jgi:hypothetical protein
MSVQEDSAVEPDIVAPDGSASLLLRVRPEPPGQYTAEVVGLPDVVATAATREGAVEQVRAVLGRWLAAGQLVPLALPLTRPAREPARWPPDDPLEQEFLEELARRRQADLERTLREDGDGSGCSDISSTPTT